MKDVERRCAEAVAEDWENSLDVKTYRQDLEDGDLRPKKRQKIESSSVEVERDLLRSAVAKASEDLALEKPQNGSIGTLIWASRCNIPIVQ